MTPEEDTRDNPNQNRPDTLLPDSLMPDAQYRPIPIAWFAGAMILQVIAMPAVFFILFAALGFSGSITIAVSLLVTALIGYLTWERGMAQASFAWRAATVAMLLFFFGITAVGVI